MIYDGDRAGILNDNCHSDVVVENSTIYFMHGTTPRGVQVGSSGGSITVTNTISMGNATADFATTGGPLIQSNNLSSDATATGLTLGEREREAATAVGLT